MKRINKYIAESGYASRRKADKLIEDGKVTINGKQAELGSTVEDGDIVNVNGTKLELTEKDLWIAFHKPVGVISTMDENADNTVADYLGIDERVFYVGRLDVASSGLMIFTNNGDAANKITNAGDDHEKEYVVTVNKPLTRKYLDALKNGIEIDGRKTKPARVKKLSNNRYNIIITEGRNRQLRKMAEAFGYDVKKLKRLRIMNVKLRDLGEGNSRMLTKKERRELLASI